MLYNKKMGKKRSYAVDDLGLFIFMNAITNNFPVFRFLLIH